MSDFELQAGDAAITGAAAGDLPAVLALLEKVDLPTDGVEEHFGRFVVAKNGEGRIVGSAGIEQHGNVGLLRSVAVDPALQSAGLGSRLTRAALDLAGELGVERVVLLTTTARDFFVGHFGFREADRAAFDARLADSPEWRLPPCSSAVCLELVCCDASRVSKG
jgi:N-acetylglutamate synthase-like GNAT family acetyltransferase